MKTIYHLILFLTLIFPPTATAQNYHVLLDDNVSSISSAESLTSLHQAMYSFEDRLIPDSIGKKIKPKWLGYITGCTFRLGKGFVWDFPLAKFLSFTHQEFSGRGYEFRKFGFIKNGYHFQLPRPYGSIGLFSTIGEPENFRKIGKHEQLAMLYGTAESSRIFSNTIYKKWILTDSIHYKEVILAIQAFGSPTFAMTFLEQKSFWNGNDILGYLYRVNAIYGFNSVNNFKLTSKHLRKRARLNFLNPFISLGFLSGIFNYGFQGKKYGELYWFKIRKVKYLPSFRVGLTPFGDEVFFESFIKTAYTTEDKPNKAARIYYRHGNPIFEKFNGFGIETIHFFNFSEKIILDFNLDGWMQPELELGGEEIRLTKKGFGGLAKINFQIRVWEQPKPVYLSGQIGYKTDGYIEGEPLTSGLILRYGFAYDF